MAAGFEKCRNVTPPLTTPGSCPDSDRAGLVADDAPTPSINLQPPGGAARLASVASPPGPGRRSRARVQILRGHIDTAFGWARWTLRE